MLIPLKKYCAKHNLPYSRIRKLAADGKLVGAEKVLERWGVPEDLAAVVLPPTQRTARNDGRYLCKIWATPEEMEALAATYDICRANPPKEVE